MPREWTNAVAVVGTREPSDYALSMTCRVVDSLAARPETIVVSGLALGIDSMAHERSLHRNLRTAAVLANGLDTVYPKKNTALAEKILAEGGCLLSETPTGYGVTKFNLALRDRLQSGLSQATLVMQSSITGGTMHTALFTLEQGRTLVVLKPPTEDDVWSGSWFLLGKVKEKWFQERQSLAKFKRFPHPWAYPITEAKLDDFIKAAIASNFTPKTNGGSEKSEERIGRAFTQVQLALA
jgi:DNA protecting protein DprA